MLMHSQISHCAANPAAVCLRNSWLDDERLRKVAAENNLSATAILAALDSLSRITG